jgi:uncharacterized protein with HEPN domain
MSRDYRLYLADIIEAIRRIKEFTDRMDFDALERTELEFSEIEIENSPN